MNKQTFKVGDKVYCQYIAREVLEIKELPNTITITDLTFSTDDTDYGIVSGCLYQKVICLKDGRCMKTHLQAIVHATQENYELLCKLYPDTEFEKPPLI